ncbi:MAG: hypothetical protein KF795_00150 [Labilithrix sp.]|nr:hypothetical protein [Labilithrix sp.]
MSLRVIILGTTYEVLRVEKEDDEGEFLPDVGHLRIAGRIAPSRRWSVLRHEIGHGAWFECGMRSALLNAGIDEASADKIEECVMDTFVPVYCDTLERADWLRPPLRELEVLR